MSLPATRTRTFLAAALLLSLIATIVASPSGRPARARGDGSGGKAVAHHAGGKLIRSRSVVRKGPDARIHPIPDKRAIEPTLGVTKNGYGFYIAIQGAGTSVMRSTNNGKSWTDASPKLGSVNGHPVTLDPYIYVDYDTSRVFTIDLTVACSYVSFSDDYGKAWTTNPLACGRPVNDHQTLFSGPPVSSPTVGYRNIVYYCWNDVASSSCSKSLDGGLSFSPTGSPAYQGVQKDEGENRAELCGGLHGHGFVDRKGTVYLPREYCGAPYLAISKNEGVTWEQVRVSKLNYGGGADPSVTVDAKGNIYYLFKAEDNLPYLAISKDGGNSWGPSLMVGPPGLKDMNLPTISSGAPGKIALAYYGTKNVKQIDKNRRDYSQSLWDGYMTISANALARNPVFYTSTVNDRRDPFYRGNCSGNGGNRCSPILDFIDVVIGPDGVPWSSFVDNVPGPFSMAGAVVGRLVGGPNLRK